MDRNERELPDQIRSAVALAMQDRVPSEEEMTWVRLAIKKEAQSIRLREAIIEKTLTSLIWGAITGGLLLIWSGFKAFLQAKGTKVD